MVVAWGFDLRSLLHQWVGLFGLQSLKVLVQKDPDE